MYITLASFCSLKARERSALIVAAGLVAGVSRRTIEVCRPVLMLSVLKNMKVNVS